MRQGRRKQIFPKLYIIWWSGDKKTECSFCGVRQSEKWAEAYSGHGRHVATLCIDCVHGYNEPFQSLSDFLKYIREIVKEEIKFKNALKEASDDINADIPDQPPIVKNAPWLPYCYKNKVAYKMRRMTHDQDRNPQADQG